MQTGQIHPRKSGYQFPPYSHTTHTPPQAAKICQLENVTIQTDSFNCSGMQGFCIQPSNVQRARNMLPTSEIWSAYYLNKPILTSAYATAISDNPFLFIESPFSRKINAGTAPYLYSIMQFRIGESLLAWHAQPGRFASAISCAVQSTPKSPASRSDITLRALERVVYEKGNRGTSAAHRVVGWAVHNHI